MPSPYKSAALTCAAILGSAVPVAAAPITFSYIGGFESFTIGTTGVYDIVAAGAQGGTTRGAFYNYFGGLGAQIGGDFTLTAGTVLKIAVGGAGALNNGPGAGGGGGSFVVTSGGSPLAIAGGGGGAGSGQDGFGGRTDTSGGGYTTLDGGAQGYPSRTVFGGTNGGGGGAEASYLFGGGGGGGFSGDGASSRLAAGGKGYPDLSGALNGGGGPSGGYGGGGAGFVGGGGGGGFSGGAGGFTTVAINTGGQDFTGGRGGGSFLGNDVLQNADLLQLAGFNSGNGFVTIDLVSAVPLLASAPMFGAALLGLAGIGYATKRKKAAAAA